MTTEIMNKKKNKRSRLDELGSEIIQDEQETKILNELVEEKKKLYEIKSKQLESIDTKLKKDILKEVGEYMETHTHRNKVNKICGELKKLFNGTIDPGWVYFYCEEEKDHWIDNESKAYGHKGSNQYTKNRSVSHASGSGLSKQDQAYLDALNTEIKRNKQISELIFSLTDKTIAEQGALIDKPGDRDFRKKLAEASYEYMHTTAKQMTPSEIDMNLAEHRTLRYLSERFCDILYKEKELRESTKHLESV